MTTTTSDAVPTPSTAAQASLYQRLRGHLAVLKLHDAAEALPSVLDRAQAEGTSMTAALEQLLSIEVDATEARRLAGRLRFACLPTPASLEDFDYDAAPGLDRKLIAELGTAAISRPPPTCCSSDHQGSARHICRWGWPARLLTLDIAPTSPPPPTLPHGVTARRSRDAGPPPCGSTPGRRCW